MFETLHKYLILNKKLHLPGIGVFVIDRLPAKLDFGNKIMEPPLPVIRFSLETSAADKYLYQFISRHLQLDEVSAIRQFNDLIFELKEKLTKEGTAALPGIGKLKKEFADTYTFQAAYTLKDYFPQVTAERVIRKNSEHTIRVGEDERTNTQMAAMLATEKHIKDKWWLYAIILTVMGIIALAYYYATKR